MQRIQKRKVSATQAPAVAAKRKLQMDAKPESSTTTTKKVKGKSKGQKLYESEQLRSDNVVKVSKDKFKQLEKAWKKLGKAEQAQYEARANKPAANFFGKPRQK